jgi:hypothetical protein
MQSRNVGSKPSFSFYVEQTRHIGIWKIGYFGMGCKRPFQRQPYDTMTLANSGGVQMIAQFASDQLNVSSQRIQCKGNRKVLLDYQGAVASPEQNAIQTAAIERKAEQTGQSCLASFVQMK